MLASYMPASVYAAEADSADEQYGEMLTVSEESAIPAADVTGETEVKAPAGSEEEAADAEAGEEIPEMEAAAEEDAKAPENPDEEEEPSELLQNGGQPSVSVFGEHF